MEGLLISTVSIRGLTNFGGHVCGHNGGARWRGVTKDFGLEKLLCLFRRREITKLVRYLLLCFYLPHLPPIVFPHHASASSTKSAGEPGSPPLSPTNPATATPRQPLPAVSAALPSLLLVTRPLEAPPSRARSDLGCKGARGTRAGPTTKSTEMPMAGGWRQGAEVEMKLTPKRAGSGGGRGKKIGPGGGGKSRSEAPSFASSS